jgi:predicted phosphodiesterase
MRHAVFSDVHANLPALEAVLRDIEARGIESKFCCGDIVGYGSSPNECIDLLCENDVQCVMGNHDYRAVNAEYDGDFEENEMARDALAWTRRVLSDDSREFIQGLPFEICTDPLNIAHGSPRDPLFEYVHNWAKVFRIYPHLYAPVTFLGHTHQPAIYEIFRKLVVNVGSVGQPRDYDPRAAYVVLDDEVRKKDGFLDMDNGAVRVVRVEYPTARASSGIIRAGLNEYLGQRLSWGI